MSNDYSIASKVLFLTGQAGIGKTLFCKQLQRELLLQQKNDFQPQEIDERYWLPIYIDLSGLKELNPQALFSALAKELSLTEEELKMLQSLDSHRHQLPHLLIIYDEMEQIPQSVLNKPLLREQDFLKSIFLNTIEKTTWNNAKIIFTCREETFQDMIQKASLSAPLHAKALFSQRKMMP